jgi:hypothetical protein
MPVSPYVDRLDWKLPEFTRFAWTGDRARAVWATRLARLDALRSEVEWRSVAAGVRACAMGSIAAQDVEPRSDSLAAHGLEMRRLERHADAPDDTDAVPWARPGMQVVIGRRGDVDRFCKAAAANDDDAQGELLGYPDCCRRFFIEYRVRQDCADTTWPMACAGVATPPGRRIDVAPDHPASNLLWRFVGVRAVPHLPCRFGCAATAEFAARLREVAGAVDEEFAWLDEILAWPVEWSCLHGIAEIKTPILKIVTRADATAGKYLVRWCGMRYPEEGASGLGFPYKSRRKSRIGAERSDLPTHSA